MNKANIFCDNCNKWFVIDYEYVGELPEMVCPKCHGDHIWFGEIECDRSKPLVMGRGGCRQK